MSTQIIIDWKTVVALIVGGLIIVGTVNFDQVIKLAEVIFK